MVEATTKENTRTTSQGRPPQASRTGGGRAQGTKGTKGTKTSPLTNSATTVKSAKSTAARTGRKAGARATVESTTKPSRKDTKTATQEVTSRTTRRAVPQTGSRGSGKTTLEVDGKQVEVSSLDKVFYPRTGFTKGQVIDYYIRISRHLLPYLKNRPITLKRYPNGVEGFFFYEKACPPRPAWVKTADVPRSDGTDIPYCLMNSLAALVWAANLADLELHTFLHTAPRIDRPQFLAFDLDPGAPADILDCARVALRLRDLCAALGLQAFPKSSGSKGMQVYVPLHTAVTYEKTKAFARTMAELLESEDPGRVTSNMRKSLRKGKVFVDWSQNDDHKTTVNVYSLRAKERPTVSTPFTWDEVASALKRKKANALSFEAGALLKRVEKTGDLFAPVLSLKQKLPSLAALRRAGEEG